MFLLSYNVYFIALEIIYGIWQNKKTDLPKFNLQLFCSEWHTTLESSTEDFKQTKNPFISFWWTWMNNKICHINWHLSFSFKIVLSASIILSSKITHVGQIQRKHCTHATIQKCGINEMICTDVYIQIHAAILDCLFMKESWTKSDQGFA